ncbi:MAG: hypothetical protein HIU57_04120 [Acidobacteria bacterium]|nr:hypothetical protein [Acidobacteriota bacterium]
MKRYWVPGLARYLARHPRALTRVARAAWRLRRQHWWRRRPWLPVPDAAYWEFRVHTVAGADTRLEPAQVAGAAEWSVRQRVGR